MNRSHRHPRRHTPIPLSVSNDVSLASVQSLRVILTRTPTETPPRVSAVPPALGLARAVSRARCWPAPSFQPRSNRSPPCGRCRVAASSVLRRYRPATTTRNTATQFAKGSVESTHKVPTSHYHTKHRTDGRCRRGRAARWTNTPARIFKDPAPRSTVRAVSRWLVAQKAANFCQLSLRYE